MNKPIGISNLAMVLHRLFHTWSNVKNSRRSWNLINCWDAYWANQNANLGSKDFHYRTCELRNKLWWKMFKFLPFDLKVKGLDQRTSSGLICDSNTSKIRIFNLEKLLQSWCSVELGLTSSVYLYLSGLSEDLII